MKCNKIVIGTLSAMLTILGFGSCKSTKMAQQQRERQLLATIDSLEQVVKEQKDMILRGDSVLRSMQNAITVYGGPNMMDRRVVVPDSGKLRNMERRPNVYGGPNMRDRRVVKPDNSGK